MELARTKSCKNIAKVAVYQKSPSRRYLIVGILVLLYAVVLPWVWNTMGAPLDRAKEEARKLDLEKTDEQLDEFEFVEVDLSVDEPAQGAEISAQVEPIDMNITLGVNETTRPLPSPYLSDAGAMAALFLVVFCHCLFYLVCHWLVWFEVQAFYVPCRDLRPGRYLHIVPFRHRGKEAIVKMARSKFTDQLEFTFQRQKFVLYGPTNRETDIAEDEELQLMNAAQLGKESELYQNLLKEAKEVAATTGYISPLAPPTNLKMGNYIQTNGFQTVEALSLAAARFGTNSLKGEVVTLPKILISQLLSPLAVFQLFSASLWLLDQYWQQSIFSVIMIVMMEFTTAFQRHRTTKMLSNLAPKPFPVQTYRESKWVNVLSDQLLPGDVISLSSSTETKGKMNKSLVVPCDCLLLSGSSVVNEATLTGESVPQMKDAVNLGADVEERLDINGKHRVHVMFSGTTLISSSPGKQTGGRRLKAPNDGCLCYVLRTGFSSSQGELMQMIEFSTEALGGSKETGFALLILLGFALLSSAYVFKRGMEEGKRTSHELLLKCVIIITSVVPQHLPVQMAAAVNYALIALTRNGILCTEPFRLPSAGKITHCFFDKTGTLTSDELVPVGVINVQQAKIGESREVAESMVPVHNACSEVAMILAGCHSLVAPPTQTTKASGSVQNLLGDPIEVAALQGVQWSYLPKDETAKPGFDISSLQRLRSHIESEKGNAQQGPDSKQQLEAVQKRLEEVDSLIVTAHDIEKASVFSSIKILSRHHFSSQLQRMSVVANLHYKDGSTQLACLVKGSPEAVKKLLKPSSIPPAYESTYRQLAEKGMRVLALGYKYVSAGNELFRLSNLAKISRKDVEEGLDFAGFIAFECKIRSDTRTVVQSLKNSAHSVVMMTGDALLTALHVGAETAICRKDTALMLKESEATSGSKPVLVWVKAIGDPTTAEELPFRSEENGCGLRELSNSYDLLFTEKMLDLADLVSEHRIWSEIDCVKLFARMSPPGKATVIRKIQQHSKEDPTLGEKVVFMCGDGGNDVGALKQADVGLALLSGFGSSNTDEKTPVGQAVEDDEAMLNEMDKMDKIKARIAQKKKKKEAADIRKKIMSKQQEYLQLELQRRQRSGEDTSLSSQFSAMKAVTFKLQEEIKEANKKLNHKYSIHRKRAAVDDDQSSLSEKVSALLEDQSTGSDKLLKDMDMNDGQVPLVRPGDASVAAPFTSRVPSIRSVVHLIRQGRCTLLSALQQQQTMMLECTITAYTYAALSLQGARQSERQLIASSWLIMTAVGSFSYATPLENMHPVKPIKSLFHPAIFSSIFLQAVIHLFCISYGVELAKAAMGEDKLQEVIDFNYKASLGLDKQLGELEDEYNPIESFLVLWQAPFKPNLLNTVCFLVQTSQTMAVFFVNYKGRPWMNGLLENHALFLSLFISIAAVAVCAWEVIPFLNTALQLEPFPDNFFRWQVMFLVFLSILGTFLVDRIMTAVFAPDVFAAMWESASTTKFADVLPLMSSLFKALIVLVLFASSNPLIWIGGYYLYRKYKGYTEAKEEAKILALEAAKK